MDAYHKLNLLSRLRSWCNQFDVDCFTPLSYNRLTIIFLFSVSLSVAIGAEAKTKSTICIEYF